MFHFPLDGPFDQFGPQRLGQPFVQSNFDRLGFDVGENGGNSVNSSGGQALDPLQFDSSVDVVAALGQ